MDLVERAPASEAAAAAILGAANSAYFAGMAAQPARPARRVAVGTLVLLNLALAAESALYLAVLPVSGPAVEGVAVFIVRSLALAAVASVSALILRQRLGGRR